ncbi:MAG: FAD-dependent 5-carboxymethylaminomethyl-2-thiouridine(34) oxidoreductase MnmC [Pseudomonadota bacterium]
MPIVLSQPDVLNIKGGLYSRQFQDRYFSHNQPRSEVDWVFIRGNRIYERLVADEFSNIIVIAETGFGTGLNFLHLWSVWRRFKQPHQRLHFISFEHQPLSIQQLKIIHQPWFELSELSQALRNHYPPPWQGTHVIDFDNDPSIRLQLVWGNVEQTLPELTGHVDAWFLDGFAPAQNPVMWSESVMRAVRRTARAGTTFATFTAAGHVRQKLLHAGFTVQKKSGHGFKRDMLVGEFKGINPLLKAQPLHIAIIGAGLSGTHLAQRCTEFGLTCDLFESNALPATGASGNSSAVLFFRPGLDEASYNRFQEIAYIRAINHYRTHTLDRGFWHETGLLQLSHNESEEQRHIKILERFKFLPGMEYLSPQQTSELIGGNISSGGLWFDQGGFIQIRDLCGARLQSLKEKNSEVFNIFYNTTIQDLKKENKKWILIDQNQKSYEKYDHVVFANAFNALDFLPELIGTIKAVAGQTTVVPEIKNSISFPITFDGYYVPGINGVAHTGSTFHPWQSVAIETQHDHLQNIQRLKNKLPNLFKIENQKFTGWTGVRCQSKDYLPLVGAVDQDLSLWTMIGFGAKGTTLIPLAADVLIHEWLEIPSAVDATLKKALSPLRFKKENKITKKNSETLVVKL